MFPGKNTKKWVRIVIIACDPEASQEARETLQTNELTKYIVQNHHRLTFRLGSNRRLGPPHVIQEQTVGGRPAYHAILLLLPKHSTLRLLFRKNMIVKNPIITPKH